jgi:hypothetical protein
MKYKLKKITRSPILIWFITSLVLASHAWVTDGLSGQGIFVDVINDGFTFWLETSLSNGSLLAVGISITIYCGLSACLYWLSSQLFRPVNEISSTDIPNSKVIILTVSKVNGIELDMTNTPATLEMKSRNLKGQLTFNSIEDDIQAITDSEIRWSWQQILRGLKDHKNTGSLEMIYAVFTESEEKDEKGNIYKDGSFIHRNLFIEWLNKYFTNSHIKIVTHSENLDPSNIKSCYELYNDVIDNILTYKKKKRKFISKNRYEESDISFDITGGTSILSAAASMATLHNKVQFQYVNTELPFDVKYYDMELNFNRQPIS